MFRIYDGRECFYQWDVGRQLLVEDTNITQVHFCNRTGDCSLVVECYELGGNWVADVPNILLQDSWRLRVYAYDGNATRYDDCFDIKARTRPDTYVYTETEVLTYEKLESQIQEIQNDIGQAVADYLEENPPAVDLADYYTKDEVDKAIDEIELTPGKDGKDGIDGYTPIKGVDYFDGKDGKDGKDGYTPIKGVDYFDGVDGKDTPAYTAGEGIEISDDFVISATNTSTGGVTSWNDLEDKPFYIEPPDVVIFEDEEVVCAKASSYSEIIRGSVEVENITYTFYSNEPYFVELNGTTYKTTLRVHDYTSNGVVVTRAMLGNAAMFNVPGTDTGEPFCIVLGDGDLKPTEAGYQTNPPYDYVDIYTVAEGTYHVVVKQQAENATIAKLDARFLPDEAVLQEELAANTEEIKSYVDEAVAAGVEGIRGSIYYIDDLEVDYSYYDAPTEWNEFIKEYQANKDVALYFRGHPAMIQFDSDTDTFYVVINELDEGNWNFAFNRDENGAWQYHLEFGQYMSYVDQSTFDTNINGIWENFALYQTEEQVNALIDAKLGVIENGSY